MEWISVNDRLPKTDYDVLAFVQFPYEYYIGLGNYTLHDKKWNVPGSYLGVVTHWMPLPEPPKE